MDRYGGFRGAEATRSGRSSAEWDSEAMKAIAEEEEANADMLTPAENMTQKEIDEAFGSIRSRGSVGRDRFGAAKIYRRSGKATSYDYAPDAANAQQPTLNAKRGTSKVVQGVPVRQESGPTKKKAA
jgi:hypothetical protein